MYGYGRIDTPVFEATGLFTRGVGEGTDIVEKEMYTFQDRSGSSLTLRPEGTAPVCRAYVEHGMSSLPQPVRLYYLAPAFRYERPQAGRMRQHHQFGFEVIGDGSPLVDAEVICLAWRYFVLLGLTRLSLIINSIGCPDCRPVYLDKLRQYYASEAERICPDCTIRLVKNPLRLLDCKEEKCQPVAMAAPGSADHVCKQCREHFGQLKQYLEIAGIPYTVSHRLVRGLDYYTRTVFEIQPENLGSQSTIGGGGRYDRLIEEIGGRGTQAIGFATGIERIILNMKQQGVPVPPMASPLAILAYTGDAARHEAVRVSSELSTAGLGSLVAGEGKSLKAQMRQANNLGIPLAIIIGPDELSSGMVTVRNLADGSQKAVSRECVVKEVTSLTSGLGL
jgi:histidyl-tRNA synthetase